MEWSSNKMAFDNDPISQLENSQKFMKETQQFFAQLETEKEEEDKTEDVGNIGPKFSFTPYRAPSILAFIKNQKLECRSSDLQKLNQESQPKQNVITPIA